MNDTANPPDRVCTIESICGFGGFHGQDPDQSFRFVLTVFGWQLADCLLRFVTPIFLHAGVVHLLLNMLAQVTASAQVNDFYQIISVI